MERLILAHDLGTSGDKATVFSEEGKLLASVCREYPTDFLPGSAVEQDPSHWWEAVCAGTRELLEKCDGERIATIAFSGQMLGCLCIDKDGKPLRKHMLYCDQRADAEAKAFIEKGGWDDIYRITGNRASSSYSAAKLMWVRDHQPEIYRRTYKMLDAKDYINFRMTGRIFTDPTNASTTNLYDLKEGVWSDKLVAAAGLDKDKLAEIIPSTRLVGELTREAAKEMGLKSGIPVISGSGDGPASGVGAGSIAPGLTYNYLGSSSWIATTTTEPIIDPEKMTFTVAHAVPGLFHPTGTMQTAASSYAWLRREFCHEEAIIAEREGLRTFEVMDRVAAEAPPGSNGLLYLPYLMGERTPHWNPLARGGFVGLTMANTRSDMIRSVLEGVAMNLSTIFGAFRRHGLPVKSMNMIGGGAKGRLWRRIMADACDVEVMKPTHLEEATSIGAAIIAGVGAGIFKDFSVVNRFFAIEGSEKPDPENVAMYKEKKLLFDQFYTAIEPLFPNF